MFALYQWLLRLYPARFREEYARMLEMQFRDEQREGTLPVARMFFDLLISLPRELFHEVRRDLAFSARVYARRPLATGLAMIALALAIGAATGVFSVINAVLLRSLPFRDPERIVDLRFFPMNGPDGPKAFHEWRTSSTYLDDAALYSTAEMTLNREPEAARVKVSETSWNFFSALGSDAFRGRAFAPGEDVPGNDSVAVIGYGLWQEGFGGDPRVLGSQLRLNGVPFTIVGVARPGFDFPVKSTVWVPTTFDVEKIPKTRVVFWNRVARLKADISLERAASIMAADAEHLNPGIFQDRRRDRPSILSLQQQLAGRVRDASFVLMGGVVLVLLIACANVAHLLLARVAERRRELAVRAALGASRARLTQQLITESVVLTSASAAAGLLVAQWVAHLVATVQPAQLASQAYTILDTNVLLFAVGIALATGLLFGVLPAWIVSRLQPSEELARGAAPNPSAGRLRQALVAAQVALALVLVAGSIAIGRGFTALLESPLGFLYRTDHALTLNVSLSGTPAAKTGQRMRDYYREALGRVRAIPQVEAAGAIDSLPLASSIMMADGLRDESGREVRMMFHTITPDYFRAAGNELLYGREFSASDSDGAGPVVIVNEQAARAFGDPRAMVGRQLRSRVRETSVRVIGVAKTVRDANSLEAAQVFWPLDQAPGCCMTIVARVRGRAADSLAVVRDAVKSAGAAAPVFNVRTFDDYVNEALAAPRFYTLTGAFFGGFAVLLAVLSIYGVVSYAIAQRRHEIGVRIAVGATPARLRRLLIVQGAPPIVIGSAAGLLGAAWLSKSVEHVFYMVGPLNVGICAAAALMLGVVSGAAMLIASRAATRVDPIQVLRAD